jgi:glyoxylase I family protein
MTDTNKKIKGCGFHHLSIKVKDLEKSIKFYTEVLGFVLKASWGKPPKRTVLLDTGDGNYFEISQREQNQEWGEGIFRHIALRANDTNSAIKIAKKAGAEVTIEPRDVTLKNDPPIPVRIAFFKGPDGELIELFQNEQT